jgi:hypothetical protein
LVCFFWRRRVEKNLLVREDKEYLRIKSISTPFSAVSIKLI